MKYKNTYRITILIISTLVLSWAIPAFVKKATASKQNYPFVYYSSLLQDFAIKRTEKKQVEYFDRKGNYYTREEYDSITPLLSYRQLTLAGNMPDSILGVEMEPRMLRVKTAMWRYSPKEIQKPTINLHLMYEAMSGRTSLESPDEIFRLKDKIEFVDKTTNEVNQAKSVLFQKKMEEKGFSFPAQHVWGNPQARKPYDEGYFVLDSKGELFHIKQVNGKPYVGNTKAGEKINIAYFSIYEIADKTIYGFILSQEGQIYTLNATGGYELTKLDIPPIDIHQHSVMMLGNLFYWMVNVTTPQGCTYHVLELYNELKKHDEPYYVEAKTDQWDKLSKVLFPIYLSTNQKDSEYIKPTFTCNWGYAFALSLALALVYFITFGRKRNTSNKIAGVLLIILFGIPAFITTLITK